MHDAVPDRKRFVANLACSFLLLQLALPCTILADAAPPSTAAKSSDADREEKERAASIAVALVGCVIILGVLLLAVVILWGNRLRRQARTPAREAPPLDPLWYLKQSGAKAEPASPSEENAPLESDTDPDL